MAKIFLFGDSIAWGFYDPENGGWAGIIKRSYLSISRSNQLYNLSYSGTKTSYLRNRIQFELSNRNSPKDKNNNTVILSVGLNDAELIDDKESEVDRDEFKANIEYISNTAKNYASNVGYIGPTPVDENKTQPLSWHTHLFQNNRNIRLYNNIAKSTSKNLEVPFLDIFSKWIKLDYRDYLYDGLHPNTKGHKLLYEQITAFLNKQFPKLRLKKTLDK